MATSMPTFTVRDAEPRRLVLAEGTELIVAGYTGRNLAAVQHHIDELAAIGVPPPPRVPMIYRYPLSLLTGGGDLRMPSHTTSGEVEPVLIRQAGAWYLGVGSDHTDRGLERESVERSKGVCPKPVAAEVIALEGDLLAGALDNTWDGVQIRSWVDGVLYQSAGLEALRYPSDLLKNVLQEVPADADLLVFSGTVPLLTGDFVHGAVWRMELQAGRTTLRLDYNAIHNDRSGS
jgi:hypothetical protein